MCERMEAEELRLYVSRDIKAHEKVFCLRAKDGRTRVVTGSANMSTPAFCGIQRENITYYDDAEAYKWYKNRFDSFTVWEKPVYSVRRHAFSCLALCSWYSSAAVESYSSVMGGIKCSIALRSFGWRITK